MATCNTEEVPGSTIAAALLAIGPRTVEGDQGRVSMHGVHDAIAAIEYDRKRTLLKNRAGVRAAPVSYTHLTLPTTPYV